MINSHVSASTVMETGDKQDDTFQKRGQPVWEIHAGVSLPGWPWKSLTVEHSYLQNVEGAKGGRAYISRQIHKGHSSYLMESAA